LQPSIRTEIGFKGLAPPYGVAARCSDHCMPRVAQGIRGIQTYRCLHLPHSFECSPSSVLPLKKKDSNEKHRSRSLSDLTEHLTTRAEGGHAPSLSVSSIPFRLTFILLSLLVRFRAYNPIKPQHPPLVCLPANSFKFQPCDRTSQAACLTSSLRRCIPTKDMQHLASSVYGWDYEGI
jgi:hypothetical protein